jgi:hypothetical protein
MDNKWVVVTYDENNFLSRIDDILYTNIEKAEKDRNLYASLYREIFYVLPYTEQLKEWEV